MRLPLSGTVVAEQLLGSLGVGVGAPAPVAARSPATFASAAVRMSTPRSTPRSRDAVQAPSPPSRRERAASAAPGPGPGVRPASFNWLLQQLVHAHHRQQPTAQESLPEAHAQSLAALCGEGACDATWTPPVRSGRMHPARGAASRSCGASERRVASRRLS